MPDVSRSKPLSGKEKKLRKSKIRERVLERAKVGGTAVEIGVWKGDFSEEILSIVRPKHLYLIDPWNNFDDHDDDSFSGRGADDKLEQLHQDVCVRFAKQISNGKVTIMREMSSTALDKFEDRSIDFAYVDGDHSYEGVKTDIAKLFPKIKYGGYMAFDDYHRKGWWKDGVLQAVHEFIGAHPCEVRVNLVAGAQIVIERLEPLG